MSFLKGKSSIWIAQNIEKLQKLDLSKRPSLRSFNHCSNRLRVEWLAALVAIAGVSCC
jgi:hypothetical protein